MASRKKYGRTKVNRSPSRSGSSRLLIVLVIVSFALMTISSQWAKGFVAPMRNAVHRIAAPFVSAGSVLSRPITALSNVSSNLTADSETLTKLQQENTELRALVGQLEEYRLENQRLSGLLGLQDSYGLESTAARVIGSQTDGFDRSITIDKGTDNGVKPNMAVMTTNGLIGQTVEATNNTAVVRLLTSENSGASALIQRTRSQGILRGNIDGTLTLEYVPVQPEVLVGDIVTTSGLGGVYPKGLIIGEVISSEAAEGDRFASIVVRPHSDVTSSEEVLVITDSAAEALNETGLDEYQDQLKEELDSSVTSETAGVLAPTIVETQATDDSANNEQGAGE